MSGMGNLLPFRCCHRAETGQSKRVSMYRSKSSHCRRCDSEAAATRSFEAQAGIKQFSTISDCRLLAGASFTRDSLLQRRT